MGITTQQVGDRTILRFGGKITIGQGDVQLRDAVSHVLDAGSNKIVLNMSAVTTIDSSGVGELVGSYTRATSRGGMLVLCCLPAKVQDILTITQLISVFQVFDSEQEALEALS